MALLKSKEPVVLSYKWDNPTLMKNLPFDEQKFLLFKIRPVELPEPPKINLILVLDKSASMEGEPLENLKIAVREILQMLDDDDRISIVLFDSEAKVLVSNSPAIQRKEIRMRIEDIFPIGGTCIDEGIFLGLQEAGKFTSDELINWMILLTDGKNEHGDNQRCLDLSREARKKGISITTIGLGRKWDPTLLEQIADLSGGKMYYVENPEDLRDRFIKEIKSVKNIAFKDLTLYVKLDPVAKLSDISPAFVITPQIKRVEPLWDGEQWILELGNLERDKEKIGLLQFFISEPQSLYINKIFEYKIAFRHLTGKKFETQYHTVVLEVTESYIEQFENEVRELIEKVGLYVQQDLAEKLINEGKPMEAITILQTMVQTAIKFENTTLKKLIEQNLDKVRQEGYIPDDLRILTKFETKMIEE